MSFTLAVILLLSGLLRVMGIFRELPYMYQHDEINTVMIALQYGRGNFAPPQFLHGSLTSYLLFLVFAGQYGLYHLLGVWKSGDDLVRQFVQDPTPFYVLGRLVMVCFGTLIVWTTYRIGLRLYNRIAGLLASLFVGVSVLHVSISQVIKEDIVASALLSLTFLLVAKTFTQIEEGLRASTARYGIVAGGIGLAAAAKYYAVSALVWIPILLLTERSHIWINFRAGSGNAIQHGLEAAKRLAATLAGALVGFVIGSPYAILQIRRFLHDLSSQRMTYQSIMPNVDGLSSLHLYFLRYLPYAVGGPILIAALIGMLFILSRRWRWRLLLLGAFPVMFLATLLKIGAAFPHFLTPIIPFIALLAAVPFQWIADRLAAPLQRASMMACALGIVSAIPILISTLRYEIYAQAPDTRTIAKRWIETYVPAHERIAVEGAVQEVITYGPPLETDRQTLETELAKIQRRGGSGRLWQAMIQFAEHSSHKQFALCKAMELTSADIDRCSPKMLVVVTDTTDRGWFVLAHDRRPFLQEIQRRYELIKQFDPYPGIRHFPSEWSLRDEFSRLRMVRIFSQPVQLITGPRIRIFRLAHAESLSDRS